MKSLSTLAMGIPTAAILLLSVLLLPGAILSSQRAQAAPQTYTVTVNVGVTNPCTDSTTIYGVIVSLWNGQSKQYPRNYATLDCNGGSVTFTELKANTPGQYYYVIVGQDGIANDYSQSTWISVPRDSSTSFTFTQ